MDALASIGKRLWKPPLKVAAPAAASTPLRTRDVWSGKSPLADADQATFQALYQSLDATGRRQLTRLMADGKLTLRDSQGNTLLSNLKTLSGTQVPAGAPYTAQDLVRQALNHLSDSSVINQSNRNTCGPTTVQYVLLQTQPSEYVRIVAGLAANRPFKLQSGSTLTPVKDAVPRDDSDRDDIERLMQSAFQNHGFELRGRYSNRTDSFRFERPKGTWGKILGGLTDQANDLVRDIGNQGIAEGKIKDLYEDVLGKQAKLIGDWPGGVLILPQRLRAGVFDEVKEAVLAGKQVPVDIVLQNLADAPGAQVEHVIDQGDLSYRDKMKSHQILVTRFEGGRVYYRNPWGYETSQTEREFRSRLIDGFIPE